MKKFTRKEVLGYGLSAIAASAMPSINPHRTDVISRSQKSGKIPLIHITDLYHPPQDPDDQIDLATILALDEYDVKGVIFDITQKFLDAAPDGWDIPRDPGFVPVAQISWMTGKAIAGAMGPVAMMTDKIDAGLDRPKREQAGIDFLMRMLEQSNTRVVITLTGSARVLAMAWNRNPDLLRSKIGAVVLNAGYTGGTKVEWNVMLDPFAYIRLFESDLPVHWYPCATDQSAFNPDHERGVYWKTTHAQLFDGISPELRAWFSHTFSGNSRGDIIRALSESGSGAVWDTILQGDRNMWATASLIVTAGRVLANTPDGWRFIPSADAGSLEVWPMRLDTINARIEKETHVIWEESESGPFKLFGRKPGAEFGVAMTEALNALLKRL